ncbi:DUF6783 domain-containing protein [Otoolea muris]
MWHKYTAKWGVQMPGMNFQTRSRRLCFPGLKESRQLAG